MVVVARRTFSRRFVVVVVAPFRELDAFNFCEDQMSKRKTTTEDWVELIAFLVFVLTICASVHALLVCKNKLTELAEQVRYISFKLEGNTPN